MVKNKLKLPKWLILLSFLNALSASAETIVSQRIAATTHLIALKKITVGPDDQYHGVVDPKGNLLVFTRKSDMAPHLCVQDLKSGEVSDLIPTNADSQEPAINPEGQVAFTYYKFRAHGDICYKNIIDPAHSNITCLKIEPGTSGAERSSPFWKSANELGFLLRDTKTSLSKIFVQNIKTGETRILAEGKLWSPAMALGGRTLIYNALLEGDERALMLKDLHTSKTVQIKLDLPGFSGFPTVSADEKYLYFSHYFEDTNHDTLIDGNDNSVVFRASLENLIQKEKIFPEQLTSAENNCSFPRERAGHLTLTCAFEGSLDVYQIPATGTVPKEWTQATLLNAHQTARTYRERLHLLNTLKFRFPSLRTKSIEERLLSNHIMLEDTRAARYYIQNLQSDISGEKKLFYSILAFYLEALEIKKAQVPGEVSRSFQLEILKLIGKIENSRGQHRFKQITKGLLYVFINQFEKSLILLKQIKFETPGDPLERKYFFDLVNMILPKTNKSTSPNPGLNSELIQIYQHMMTAPELSEESRIYYAFHFLKYLENVNTSNPKLSALKSRISTISQLLSKIPNGAISTLLKSEIVVLKIIDASNDQSKMKIYPELDQLMSQSRSDYFLRKALYIRSIINFSKAAEFKFLDFIANAWFRYTDASNTEFFYARAIFSNTELDHAYDAFGQAKYDLARGYFFGSLSLTDDLESHMGYIRTMLLKNERATIDERYANLKARSFIDDNLKFVQALLNLIDSEPVSAEDIRHIDFSIEKLKSMEQDRDSPIRYLFLGYCYLEKLHRLSDGYDFDRDLFMNANRNLMLAYDLGRDNDRIKASALMNLGLLHQRAQNPGLAAIFFAKRKELGFISEMDAARFAWVYSRALFYTEQSDKAVQELEWATKPSLPKSYQAPMKERRAFYLQSSGKFEEAAHLYANLLNTLQILGDLNLAKTYLGYGFSLFKLNKPEAKEALLKAIEHADRLVTLKKGKERLIDFQPIRIKLITYGFLSQMGATNERLSALDKRATLLQESRNLGSRGLFDDAHSLLIQNRLQVAALSTTSDPKKAAQHIQEALQQAEELGDSGQYYARAVFEATIDYLAHAILHPEHYRADNHDRIKKLIQKLTQTFESQKTNPSSQDARSIKLERLWSAFSKIFL